MSWIRSIAPEQASPELAAIYERLRARSSHGVVGNFWRALGSDPATLETVFAQVRALVDAPAPLTAAQVELIVVVVSATNGCGYCVSHHGPDLAAALGDETLARAVARDYREANLAARDRVLLDYAVALTCEPAERTQDDVERVREYGFDDATLLRATALAALYNQVNRLMTALGVQLEPGVEVWEFGEQR